MCVAWSSLAATLPRTQRASPERPCVVIAIKPGWCFSDFARIPAAGSDSITSSSTSRPVDDVSRAWSLRRYDSAS